jgi:hypothetical protein
MKRAIFITLILLCSMQAIEHSHRIIALGTDLADLVPDYETDLYRNPQILDRALAGISYKPGYSYRYWNLPYPPFYISVLPTPISSNLLKNNLGIMGEYWFDYSHDLEPAAYDWLASTFQAYRIQDLWMHRIKKFVINIYNDLDYSKIESTNSANATSSERDLEYIIRTQAAFKVGKNLNLDIKIGFGFFEHKSELSDYAFYDQRVNLGLARVGLFCRKIKAANDFSSWYFDIGSPLSNTEIDSIPFSLYSSVLEDERVFLLAAKTMVWRLGFARAMPVTRNGMVVIGLKNAFLLQSTGNITAETGLRGIHNRISVPIGMEHSIAAVTLRFGAKFFYDFRHNREASEDSAARQNISHDLNYAYSFGFGWKPHKKLTLDLYNTGNLTYLSNWGLYIKYAF